MKAQEYIQTVEIPNGVDCVVVGRELSCSKSGVTLKRIINELSVEVKIAEGKIKLPSDEVLMAPMDPEDYELNTDWSFGGRGEKIHAHPAPKKRARKVKSKR